MIRSVRFLAPLAFLALLFVLFLQTTTTNANSHPSIHISGTPQGPIHSPVPIRYATGIPAITPHSPLGPTSNPNDVAAFTADDVKTYVLTASYPVLTPTQGAHLSIEKILFIPSSEATQLMHGETTGLPDTALVCYVLLKGPFHVQIDRSPSDLATTSQTALEVAEVFDAHTGNLLVWAVLA